MNRNQRIAISIVGIVIVLLALIGITYAYWATRTVYNSEEKSIVAKSGYLELTYSDGNGTIAPTDPIMPGESLPEKTFSVKHTGTRDTIYYAVVMENVLNELTRKEDLVYTITCTSSDNKPCNGVQNDIFPSGSKVLLENEIDVGVTHNYSIKITYKDPDEDQSVDMKKSFSGKINIAQNNVYGISPNNPYKSGTLAYEIINNADPTKDTFKLGKTMYTIPETTAGAQVNNLYEKILGTTPDKYGTSYYYRGNVTDNYLTFANMCWRIVRIQGDGSTKIILQDKLGPCSLSTTNGENAFIATSEINYGYKNSQWDPVADYLNCSVASSKASCLRTKLQNWFNGIFTTSSSSQTAPSDVEPTLKGEYTGKIKYEEWEIGNWSRTYSNHFANTWYFEVADRLFVKGIASLMPSESGTNSVKANDYISTLTADEVTFAGASGYTDNTNYYLYTGNEWWTLSPGEYYALNSSHSAKAMYVGSSGYLSTYGTSSSLGARPAIVLESSVQVTGEGTLDNPYVVK